MKTLCDAYHKEFESEFESWIYLHLNTWVIRSTAGVKSLAQEHKQCPPQGSNPETSTLTMRPPRLNGDVNYKMINCTSFRKIIAQKHELYIIAKELK